MMMHDEREIQNANFREVKEATPDVLEAVAGSAATKGNKNVPATLANVALVRHDLMAGKVTAEIEKIQMELEIDKELGLKQQAENTSKRALAVDIDELTKSNNYLQVSKSMLERLFDINRLRFICWGTNIQSFFKSLSPTCLTPFILSFVALAAVPVLIVVSQKTFAHPATATFGGFCAIVATIVGWALMALTGGFGINKWSKVKVSWDAIDVRLDSQILSTVTAKIPLGAKMKVLEAKRTNIFEDFVFIHPMFTVERKEIDVQKYIPRVQIDPAILGVTKDKRMYMVVYWDVKHDIEHVIKQIGDFKKFKVTE